MPTDIAPAYTTWWFWVSIIAVSFIVFMIMVLIGYLIAKAYVQKYVGKLKDQVKKLVTGSKQFIQNAQKGIQQGKQFIQDVSHRMDTQESSRHGEDSVKSNAVPWASLVKATIGTIVDDIRPKQSSSS